MNIKAEVVRITPIDKYKVGQIVIIYAVDSRGYYTRSFNDPLETRSWYMYSDQLKILSDDTRILVHIALDRLRIKINQI